MDYVQHIDAVHAQLLNEMRVRTDLVHGDVADIDERFDDKFSDFFRHDRGLR
jgi:hypothetical protein